MKLKPVIIAVVAVITVFLGVLSLTTHKSDPFARFQAFVSSHQTFKAAYTVSVNDHVLPSGSLLVDKPTKRFLLSAGPYTASSTEKGYIEINREDSSYMEGPATGTLEIFNSKISGLPESAPSLILSTNLQRAIPKNPTISSQGQSDEIHGISKGERGQIDFWVTIDPSGQISKYRVKQEGMGHIVDYKWTLSYSFPSKPGLSAFATPLPLGFEPFYLPEPEMPIQKGKPFPVSNWKSNSGGTADFLQSSHQKPFLVAILDKSGPSEAAKKGLDLLRDKLTVFVIGPGNYKDPSGQNLKKINAPGCPSFFLVDRTGKVEKLWYGFDRSHAQEFAYDVLSSAAEAPVAKSP